jgi:DNA-binding response OmpR family regulator
MARADTSNLVYVLEDDLEVATIIVRILREFGFVVEHMSSGRDLIRRFKQRPSSACIVDLGLPDGDGISIVRDLNSYSPCAVIVVTGRQDLADRVLGLEVGADDYIVKPFEGRELVARVRSAIRRLEKGRAGTSSAEIARFRGWAFNPTTLCLRSSNGDIHQLSTGEATLLLSLLRRPNRILSREQLLPDRENVPFDRSIDARISRLRKRLGDDPQDPSLIKTIYGGGYMLTSIVAWEADDEGPNGIP